MELSIETWMPYRCDFKPVTTNSLFSEALGRIASLALRAESEFLYMESIGGASAGSLVPESLIRPRISSGSGAIFAMVFSYSERMEAVLSALTEDNDDFSAGITLCGIWNSSILMDECKVLMVASENPFFDMNGFLKSLDIALSGQDSSGSGNVPYFAEKFGYRRYSIAYETDNITELQISQLILNFEFDETINMVGAEQELTLDLF